ncbi:MAG: hypothetical protein RR890_05865 [Longicatena sp.]
MALVVSTFCFILFIFIGIGLNFIPSLAYAFIPVYIVALYVFKSFYQEGTCISIEGKDYVMVFFMVLFFLCILEGFHIRMNFGMFWYLYLITFVSFLLFVDSIRYKSLI